MKSLCNIQVGWQSEVIITSGKEWMLERDKNVGKKREISKTIICEWKRFDEAFY